MLKETSLTSTGLYKNRFITRKSGISRVTGVSRCAPTQQCSTCAHRCHLHCIFDYKEDTETNMKPET